MPVIDIHEHIAPQHTIPNPEDGRILVTAAEMVAVMDRHGIDKAIVLPLVNPETFYFVQSNDEAFAACDQYPDRFIKFCNIDPRHHLNRLAYDFLPLFEYYQAQGAVGLGEVTANLWWDDLRVQNLLRACDKVGFPMTFHIATQEFNMYGLITEPGLGGLERALQKYPNIKFLGHSPGWWSEVSGKVKEEERNGYPTEPVAPGGRVPELMRKYPNMRGDLSSGSGCNALTRDPEWGYDFIEEFQDRLLMGLDICYPDNDEAALIGFLRNAVSEGRVSREAFDKIMGGNAVALLGLTEQY